MKLVEIIRRARRPSDETVARAYDYVQAIGKTPIVVNDSRGFFTSRVFGTFVMEGAAMLDEGIRGAAGRARGPRRPACRSGRWRCWTRPRCHSRSTCWSRRAPMLSEAGQPLRAGAPAKLFVERHREGVQAPCRPRRRAAASTTIPARWAEAAVGGAEAALREAGSGGRASPSLEAAAAVSAVHRDKRAASPKNVLTQRARGQHRLDLRHRLPRPGRAARSSSSRPRGWRTSCATAMRWRCSMVIDHAVEHRARATPPGARLTRGIAANDEAPQAGPRESGEKQDHFWPRIQVTSFLAYGLR